VNLDRKLLGLVSAALVCACSGSPPVTSNGNVGVAADVGSLKNDGTPATVTAFVTNASGVAASGTVTFSASTGNINGSGTTSATVALDAQGHASVTYSCDFISDAAHCGAQTVLITATWSGVSNGTHIALTGSTSPAGGGGGGGGGATTPVATKIDTGTMNPSFLVTSDAVNVAQNLLGTAAVTFIVKDQNNAPLSGTTVTFSELAAENLVTFTPATAVSNGAGVVTVNVSSKTTRGTAHVIASFPGASATFPVPIVGGPTSIVTVSAVPSLLGLQGSGIQETGLMTFLVTDSAGAPVPGISVTFSQAQPALTTLGHSSGITAADGTVAADYSAGPRAGITSIRATVDATLASTSHAVAVRGAKPSASGFYFRCSKLNLPVYTTTLEYETTTCTVRLSDRYGNRVGIATPVAFASEAGSISAVATTKPFDFNSPADPDEGSVTVTFSSDMGNGFSPVETTPFIADPAQFPKARGAEPFNGAANPRDQLVTIIAMVRGEEAFVDANLNGQYDAGELFVDQGDPFIDANDDNVYDPETEPRFCGGASCASYHGPNGVWDSDETIWAPAWIAFTGAPNVFVDPWFPVSCLDYSDNDAGNPVAASTLVAFTDGYGNTPAAGTTYAAALVGSTDGVTLLTLGAFAELESTGAADISWEKVSANNPTLPCTLANTVNGACVMKTELGTWDDGYRLQLSVANGNKTPAAAVPGHACGGTATAGTFSKPFTVQIDAIGPHVDSHGYAGGFFGTAP